MNFFTRLAGGLLAACLGLFPVAGPVAAAPLEAYGRLPMIEDAQISPDGTMIAFAVTDGEKRFVLIRRIGEEKPVARVEAGSRKVRDIAWAGSRFLIVTTSQTSEIQDVTASRGERMIAVAYDLSTGKQQRLMEKAMDSVNMILSQPQPRMIDGEQYVVVEGVYFLSRTSRVALFSIRLRDGETRLLNWGYPDTTDWVAGPDGQPLAESEYDGAAGLWRFRMRDGKDWKIVEETSALIDGPWLSGLGRDGRSVLVGRRDEDGYVTYREFAAAGAAPVTVDTKYEGLIRDPATSALIGSWGLVEDSYRYEFFNAKDAAVWKGVEGAFPGNRLHLVSWSENRRKIIVLADSPVDGLAYGMVDLDTKSAEWLGQVYGGIQEADVSPVQSIRYKAADGLEITGYLTLPKGRDPTNLPLIVLPHGGPAARDTPGFDWWAQALASRGYAVLQPNFRGSTGFGRDFTEAGHGEWGRKMQTDLSDGVRDLAAKGTIDPKRVCIVGASYGGYAALAGATIDTGVYRCAASIAGVSDLRRMLAGSKTAIFSSGSASFRYWSRFMGVEKGDESRLAAVSPVLLADRVTIPVLLVHGKDDTVVPYVQSQLMADALKRAGKPVELVTLDGEDHWLSRGATRMQMLKTVVDFLEKHNPPN